VHYVLHLLVPRAQRDFRGPGTKEKRRPAASEASRKIEGLSASPGKQLLLVLLEIPDLEALGQFAPSALPSRRLH